MNDRLSLLFHELVDLSPTERERILCERRIEPELRAELLSLLSFDDASDHRLTECVSEAAEVTVQAPAFAESAECGPYRLVRLLGSGGMGTVYLAERADGEIQQQVAIKLLRAGADRPTWHDRFLRERQLLAGLNHPAITHVLDAGHTNDGRPYLVMEFVDGIPIDAYAAPKDLRDQLALFLRVCEAVAHAHRHLIIHRDLKPSNILVDASGNPKLLDFGIAKLAIETDDRTQTAERMFTLDYASPEQLRGANQTTATDIYSLGAVLYKVLTGRPPHDSRSGIARAIEAITNAAEITPARRLKPDLPADIDFILRKALRHEPEERYASVEAFANDIRAFLEWRPVEARSGNSWYRTRKFLRRYWLPVAATTVTVTGLSLGLFIASRERAIAQRRFDEVRRLSNKVLDLDKMLRGLPGSTKARHEVVAMSKEYLEALRADAGNDPDLALDVGVAYLSLARAQGVPSNANLGQADQAVESLKRADTLLEFVAKSSPNNRRALLNAAEVDVDQMILADTSGRHEQALAEARSAAARLDALLNLGQPTRSELGRAVPAYYNVALLHKNMHLYEDTIRYARRGLEISENHQFARMQRGSGLSIVADALRLSGDLDGALAAIQEARRSVEAADFPDESMRRSAIFNVLWREGVILGEENSINLGQLDRAVAVFQEALTLTDEWAKKDPNDANSRLRMASAAIPMVDILKLRDPQRAFAVYESAMLRLAEVRKNTTARHYEAQLLAGVSYALRCLRRTDEARARIDEAFHLLRQTKDYPAKDIDIGEPPDHVLRALAAHYVDTGQPESAIRVYQELLDGMNSAKPEAWKDLRHAVAFANIYAALAHLYRGNQKQQEAASFAKLRLDLWLHWGRSLPGNPFVQRQLQTANEFR